MPVNKIKGRPDRVAEDRVSPAVVPGAESHLAAALADQPVIDRVVVIAFLAVDEHQRFVPLVGGINDVFTVRREREATLHDPTAAALLFAIDDDVERKVIAGNVGEAILIGADDD